MVGFGNGFEYFLVWWLGSQLRGARCSCQSLPSTHAQVFCNSAIKAAERDHEMQVWALMQTRRELREQVEFLFHKIDPGACFGCYAMTADGCWRMYANVMKHYYFSFFFNSLMLFGRRAANDCLTQKGLRHAFHLPMSDKPRIGTVEEKSPSKTSKIILTTKQWWLSLNPWRSVRWMRGLSSSLLTWMEIAP